MALFILKCNELFGVYPRQVILLISSYVSAYYHMGITNVLTRQASGNLEQDQSLSH